MHKKNAHVGVKDKALDSPSTYMYSADLLHIQTACIRSAAEPKSMHVGSRAGLEGRSGKCDISTCVISLVTSMCVSGDMYSTIYATNIRYAKDQHRSLTARAAMNPPYYNSKQRHD